MMRKLIIMLLTAVILLAACGTNKDKPSDQKTKMAKEELLDTLEQMTYRYIEATEQSNGSFEQRTTFQAAINRAESVYDEVKEQYEVDEKLMDSLLSVRTNAKLGAEKGLDESYAYVDIHLDAIIEIIQELSEEHLEGDFPPSIKKLIN